MSRDNPWEDLPMTLLVPSHSLYGSRGLIRPAKNPALVMGAGRHCNRNRRWWADSPAEARAKMISWCKFAGLREVTPKETAQWAKEWGA